ncbi:MAG TPA: glycosyltransferase family 4 protein, partial [Opitutales bacterium]|nr:glycosyltransferase family 4 protein [Opitutales bacterium]
AENAEPGGGNVVLPELPHCAFRVVYAGNVGPVQGLENAVLAAGLLRDDGVELAIAGDGLELARLKALAAEKGIANVQFTGRLPLEAMPELFARADALLVMLKTDALSRISIPSKLQSYLQSGKPVVAAIAGETAELVVEKGFGVACDPTSPEAVAQAVRSLVRMTGGERLAMGERARAVFREEFCGTVQGVALCELLERSGPSAGERCT